MNEPSIFLAALDFADPAERSAYLIKACAGDADLLKKIEALLASHEKSGDFLDVPALRQMSDTPGLSQALESRTRDEIDLSYLTPSAKPDSLGTLGHYEIFQVLGHGGFGTVLKAFDEKLHRFVAIKVLSRELAATSPPRKRFLREARSVAAIKNENVIAIHSVEEQPLPYFVMEFVDGATLQDRMDESGPLPVSEILHIGKQIASGLAAAHALGLIHRDIKPANILLEKGDSQKVKITDFGLARAADDASMTQSGMIAGTPLYMAPEQARGAALDARTDLFSLGSVLYAQATGHPPFRAPNTFAVLRRVTDETPRPIQEVISDIPNWLVAIINKLLAKEPEDRFQSAQELADVLAKCHSEFQSGGPVTAANKFDTARIASSVALEKTEPNQNKFPIIGVAAGVLLMFSVMAAGLFFLNKSKDTSPAAVVSPPPAVVPSSSTKDIAPDGKTSERSSAQTAIPRNRSTRGMDANRLPGVAPMIVKRNVGGIHATPGVANPNDPLPATFKNSIGMEFVKVPKGTAWLGGWSGQQGSTKFDIEQDFYLGKFEVTQEEWEAVTGLTPSHFSRTGAGAEAVKMISDVDLKRFPVEQVSWEDCQLFIELLNKKEKDTGRVYRLPMEAEWEYACRGGPGDQSDSAFDFYFAKPTNTLLPDQANIAFPNAIQRTVKVGSYDGNMLGLHDMHGNVMEWCDDENSNKDSKGGSYHMLRGGSWNMPAERLVLKSADRGQGLSSRRQRNVGLRVAMISSGIPGSPEASQK
jgi:eukaryotic-like serine/threonine-protein kinase